MIHRHYYYYYHHQKNPQKMEPAQGLENSHWSL